VQDCTARGYKEPAAAVRTLVVPEEVVSNRLVAVDRIAAAVHTAAAVEQATGIHRSEDKVRAPACFAVCAAGAAQGMVSSWPAAAGAAQNQRRQQQDVLREACRCRMKSAAVAICCSCVVAKREAQGCVVL
jgi:hypothetical protein